jgi:hypothetical protein
VWSRCGVVIAAVAAVAEYDAPVEELRHGVAGQLSGAGLRAWASIGTMWRMVRSTTDWLV